MQQENLSDESSDSENSDSDDEEGKFQAAQLGAIISGRVE